MAGVQFNIGACIGYSFLHVVAAVFVVQLGQIIYLTMICKTMADLVVDTPSSGVSSGTGNPVDNPPYLSGAGKLSLRW